MTTKELAMRFIVKRVTDLENEIDKLLEALADKKEELERLARLAKYLETKNEFED